jgi:hypothetical protein
MQPNKKSRQHIAELLKTIVILGNFQTAVHYRLKQHIMLCKNKSYHKLQSRQNFETKPPASRNMSPKKVT